MEKLKQEIEEFFNLPIEEKMRYEQEEGDLQGYGQAFVLSEEQKLDWGDMFYLVTLPTYLRRPHLFPNLTSPFRYKNHQSPLTKAGGVLVASIALSFFFFGKKTDVIWSQIYINKILKIGKL